MIKMRVWLGQQGVAASESNLARKIGLLFFIATLPLMLILAADLREAALFGRGYVLMFFALNVLVLGSLVKDKALYFKTNWAPLAIVIIGTPVVILHHFSQILPHGFSHGFFQAFLVILILSLLLPWVDVCVRLLVRGHAAGILLIALMVIMLIGIFAFDFLPFSSLADGLWWAFGSATTLSFDEIPGHAAMSHIIAVFLVLAGMCLFSVFTANLGSFLTSLRVENTLAGVEEEAEEATAELLVKQNKAILAELHELRGLLEAKPSAPGSEHSNDF